MKNRTINSSCLKAALPLAGLAFLLCSICVFGQSIEKGKAMYEAKKYMEAESVFKMVPEKAREYAAARYFLASYMALQIGRAHV